MAAFTDLDWLRFDVWAIVANEGLATIEESRHAACRQRLDRERYAVDSLDCRKGLVRAIPELGRMLRWQDQFGYSLDAESRNLDALRDGFNIQVPADGGSVFEVLGAERACRDDERWFLGLAAIIAEHSLWHLALGRKFFGLFVIPAGSKLIGKTVDTRTIPVPRWSPPRELHDSDH